MPLNVRPDTKTVSLGEPFVKTDQFKKDKLASVIIIKKAFKQDLLGSKLSLKVIEE